MTAEPRSFETVQGLVDRTSETGLRINETWYSVSRFRPIALPPVGVHVRLVADNKRFIKQLEVLGEPIFDTTRRTIASGQP
jgi:hypothetical protein